MPEYTHAVYATDDEDLAETVLRELQAMDSSMALSHIAESARLVSDNNIEAPDHKPKWFFLEITLDTGMDMGGIAESAMLQGACLAIAHMVKVQRESRKPSNHLF